ncbi:MAG: glycosyltransferase family 1 protein [Desulfobacteraceae bacterium]|nr:MAG: glycosyltransferase family 1 protein [Desulfobacteraceae bacterium]
MMMTVNPDPLRILYLSFDLTFINPTQQFFRRVLNGAGDLTLFGPGFVSADEVDAGPEAFAQRKGPFDIVIGDEFSMLRPGEVPEEKKHLHTFRYYACRFDELLIHKGTDYFAFLKKHKGPRFLSLLQSDYYNFKDEHIEKMEEIADYYIAWGSELLMSKAAASFSSQQLEGMNGKIYDNWNDRYRNYINRHSDRILSTPHFVADDEFSELPLNHRAYDWSVLGADYQSRLTAKKLLEEAGISRSGTYLPYLFSAAQKLHFHLYNKFWAIRMINVLFGHALRTSRYSFTCGSLLRYPIRKFFEIPAAGCVLVTDGCNGFESLGFQDRKNAVVCPPEHILETHEWLTRNPDQAQAIATAGRELVKNTHSVSARGRQLGESFNRMMKGKFFGTYWSGGRLHFHENPAGAVQEPDGTSTGAD